MVEICFCKVIVTGFTAWNNGLRREASQAHREGILQGDIIVHRYR